jgi:hypothetical protein
LTLVIEGDRPAIFGEIEGEVQLTVQRHGSLVTHPPRRILL